MVHRLKQNRPKLTSAQIIKHMENNKGITFKYITRTQAALFLQSRNNYFRLMAYKSNYSKDNNNKYINLDFA